MKKKLSEEILQIIKYPVCAINDCTVCKEKCDQILTAVKEYTAYVIGESGDHAQFCKKSGGQFRECWQCNIEKQTKRTEEGL